VAKVKDLSIDELEFLIEQKILEFFGDPDSGLELKPEFKEELERRLKLDVGTDLQVCPYSDRSKDLSLRSPLPRCFASLRMTGKMLRMTLEHAAAGL
jgi:hypothetical protein